jgi:hypothetical protein
LTNIKTSNGSFKTTTRGRLDAINRLFFEVIARLGQSPSVIMDVGISSGVTTAEWLVEFRKRNMAVRMIATDVAMTVYLVQLSKSMSVLLERNGHILQIDVSGHGVRPWCRQRDFLSGAFLWRKALVEYARYRLTQLHLNFLLSTDMTSESLAGPTIRCEKLVLSELADEQNVTLLDDDILVATSPSLMGSADVVRLANVLQFAYFDEAEIRIAVKHIRERCRGEGSIVIVCHNRPEGICGSIFRMNSNRHFVVEARLGRGSEIESAFTNFNSERLCI